MVPQAFQGLCHILRRDGDLQDTQRATVKEQVGKFLHMLAHNQTTQDQFLRQPDGTQVLLEILQSSRFNPYFKDCIGALNGTHVRVKVSNEDASRYRGKKGYTTQNVLAGYMNRSRLIAPYRGVRYHLKEYVVRPLENAKELFNLRHASLRTVIERVFGVFKKRFPIIASTIEPNYYVDTQNEIILACCMLHSYLMGVDPNESLIAKVDEEVLYSHHERVAPTPREDDERH
ncbi:uncharacterized protein LOC126719344 [Quercus robur]|uniref:uncharacterized protein LOC126719344 n=1 Tax=Quercus robur TaxID=38942 RepID=UPI00216224C7|nr:uncharacterized protein LOC126719344 [Quercus robur]